MPHPPHRTCVGCGRVREKKDLLRLAILGRTLRVDPKARLPGRGLYVCREEGCLLLAEKAGALRRWVDAAEAGRVLAELRAALGAAPEDREGPLHGYLGLARRGGSLEVGLRGAVERLRRGEGVLLVTARDISERGAREAAHAAREAGVPHVVFGTRASLGRELGSGEVVAALVLDRDLARGLLGALGGRAGAETEGRA